MATNEIDVGSYGRWKIEVLRTGGDGETYSTVRVRAWMYNDSLSRSYNNNGVSVSVSGSGSYSATKSFDISAGGNQLMIDKSFTVSHTGSKTVNYTATLGSTGTSTFGSGGSVSAGITLPSNATKPDAPTTPSITSISNTSVTLDINDNDDGGASITKREIGISTTTSSADATWYTANSSGTYTKTGLSPGGNYYAWGRVTNSVGVSSISGRRNITMEDVPDAPSTPAISSVTQTTAYVTFTDGANNGASISERQIGWDTASSPGTPANLVSSDGSTTVDSLPPGKRVYFWARERNTYGWGPWSARAQADTVAGAYVTVGSVRKKAVPYLKVSGVWKLVRPWVKSFGVWRTCG